MFVSALILIKTVAIIPCHDDNFRRFQHIFWLNIEAHSLVAVHRRLRLLAQNECNKSKYDSALFELTHFGVG